jgi:DNA-binding GntR family transcriptional regulator
MRTEVNPMPQARTGAVSTSSAACMARTERTGQAVARELRRMILTLALTPGASYTEAYLTELLSCGRAALREAIQRLAQEHLLVAQPHRSVSVATLSLVEQAELAELAGPLWEIFSRWAAERITDGEIAELEDVLVQADVADQAGDFPRVAELNARVHELIVRAAKNRFAVDSILPLLLLQTRFTLLALRRFGNNQDSLADHRRIVEALKRRDPDEAQLCSREEQERMRARLRAIL